MTPDQPWMWHWGGWWVFPTIMFVVMIIFFFRFFRRGGCFPPWWNFRGPDREGGERDTALEILKKRYAKGEITKDEFAKMKKDISSEQLTEVSSNHALESQLGNNEACHNATLEETYGTSEENQWIDATRNCSPTHYKIS